MKYFKNIPQTLEELKKVYRSLCLSLHPDRGGNAQEFKAMSAEYQTLCNNFAAAQEMAAKAAEREEWARKEAERRAEEARREAEEARKAAEALRPIIEKWRGILEQVPEVPTYNSEKKAHTAYVAATKRNIKRVLNHYYPETAFTVSLTSGLWSGGFSIKWTDGPSEKQVESVEEIALFVSRHYESDPYADHGSYNENTLTKAWREAFGGSLGYSCTDYKLNRQLSAAAHEDLTAKAAKCFKNWSEKGGFAVTAEEFDQFATTYAPGADVMQIWRNYVSYYQYSRQEGADCYASNLINLMREYLPLSALKADTAPKFAPTYGKTYKAIKKALGANVFGFMEFSGNANRYGYQEHEQSACDIFQLLEDLTEKYITLCKHSEYDGKEYLSPVDQYSNTAWYTISKADEKRIAKFAAVGVTLEKTRYGWRVSAISQEVREALTAELADIEEQRKQWEAKQNGNDQNEAKAKAEKVATTDEAPAEGLWLSPIPGGVAICGDSRTTYANRKQIKAHGAKWNRITQLWEATGEAAENVRKWFGLDEQPTATPDEPTTAQTSEDLNTPNEPTATPDQATAEAVATFAATLYDICANIAKAAKEAQEQAEKTASEAKATATPDEPTTAPNEPTTATAEQVQTLRDNIANLSAQMAAMSEQLRQMSEQLANLTANPTEEPTAPTEGGKAQETATSSPRYTQGENLGSEPEDLPKTANAYSYTLGESRAHWATSNAFGTLADHIKALADGRALELSAVEIFEHSEKYCIWYSSRSREYVAEFITNGFHEMHPTFNQMRVSEDADIFRDMVRKLKAFKAKREEAQAAA